MIYINVNKFKFIWTSEDSFKLTQQLLSRAWTNRCCNNNAKAISHLMSTRTAQNKIYLFQGSGGLRSHVVKVRNTLYSKTMFFAIVIKLLCFISIKILFILNLWNSFTQKWSNLVSSFSSLSFSGSFGFYSKHESPWSTPLPGSRFWACSFSNKK